MSRRRIIDNIEDGNIVNGYEFVDLGLSVDWCTCNIGANSPEEYGWFFQWGGTTPYGSDRKPISGGSAINFDWNKNCPYWVSGSSSSSKWSKYTTSNSYSSTGTADNKTTLEPVDDAAHVHIGGKCRIPTEAEINELINACNTTWVTNYNGSGVSGKLFTLKSDTSKTLFFPASGFLAGTNYSMKDSFGFYYSSSLSTSYSYSGRYLYFESNNQYMDDSRYRYNGFAVRAVKPKK